MKITPLSLGPVLQQNIELLLDAFRERNSWQPAAAQEG